MEKIQVLFLCVLILAGCRTIQYVPVEHTEYVTVRDTTYLHKTDTLVKVPDVSITDFIDARDTLVLKASNATAKAWVDTTFNTLKGTLVQGGKLPVQIVERERVVYRDSIVKQDVPVPFEVEKKVKFTPWYTKTLAFFGILALIVSALWALKKVYFRK